MALYLKFLHKIILDRRRQRCSYSAPEGQWAGPVGAGVSPAYGYSIDTDADVANLDQKRRQIKRTEQADENARCRDYLIGGKNNTIAAQATTLDR